MPICKTCGDAGYTQPPHSKPCPDCKAKQEQVPDIMDFVEPAEYLAKQEELKPCPFCGENVEDAENIPQNDGSRILMIQCCNCGLSMVDVTEKGIIKTWDTREGGAR